MMMHAEAGRIVRRMATTWPWRGPRHTSRNWPGERYAGESVLRDLIVSGGSAESTVRIIARFAAVRAVSRTFEGGTAAALCAERGAAMDQLAGLTAGDAERRALESAVALLQHPPSRRLARSLLSAASCARAARHREGALALHALAWRVARDAGAAREAVRAARALESAARAAGIERAARIWRRRAFAHEAVRAD